MKVSVIIPVYNGEADLPDLLTALQAQTYAANQVEYLLVDNNSHDRTGELLAAAVSDFQRLGLTLKVYREDQIQSSYAARNTGIRAAQGEYVAFTDADCRPDRVWLAHLMAPFANPDLDLVVGEILGLPSQNGLEQYAEHRQVLSQHHTLNHPFCPYGQTANLGVRRSLFATIGLFRPYLTTGGDADFCWRVLHHSDRQYAFAPEAIVYHRHRSTWQELAKQWQRYGRSNRYLHQLHGVPLMAKPQLREQIYLLLRWLLREVPPFTLAILGAILRGQRPGKPIAGEFWATPISLYCNYHRFQGQQRAILPPGAEAIDVLS